MWWGPELIQLYNEACAPLLRDRHPSSLGRPARESWAHAWSIIAPVVETVLRSRTAAVVRGVPVTPDKEHAAAPVDFYYNAILGESGYVGGLFAIVVDSVRRAEQTCLYKRMLEAAVRLTASDFASLQLFDPERQELRLIAHNGFPADAAAFWDRVGAESGTACGKALQEHRRVVVADVDEAPFIRGTIDLRVFRDAGIRAVQTTPLVASDRRLIGMLSTHWRQAHRPAPVELERFDLLAREVADVLAGTL